MLSDVVDDENGDDIDEDDGDVHNNDRDAVDDVERDAGDDEDADDPHRVSHVGPPSPSSRWWQAPPPKTQRSKIEPKMSRNISTKYLHQKYPPKISTKNIHQKKMQCAMCIL